MPMSVSPDRRFLFAAVRSKPFTVITYAIDRKTGALSKRSDAGRWPRASRTSGWTGPARFLLGASYGGNLVSVNAIGKDGAVSEPQAGDPDRAQRPLDHHRQHQPLRLRAAPGHRPDLPVPLRREDRPADREHAAGGAAEGRVRPAPHHHVGRQPVRLPAQRADRDGDHALARREDGPADRGRARPRRCRPTPSSSPAPRGPRARGATSTTTSGRPTCTSRRTASSSTRPSGPAARSARSAWIRPPAS